MNDDVDPFRLGPGAAQNVLNTLGILLHPKTVMSLAAQPTVFGADMKISFHFGPATSFLLLPVGPIPVGVSVLWLLQDEIFQHRIAVAPHP